MYKLGNFYGRNSYVEWRRSGYTIDNLKPFQEKKFPSESIQVETYLDLVEVVSFLTLMNKRHTLMFRGQGANIPPIPRLFRSDWCFLDHSEYKFNLTAANREKYWSFLSGIGAEVFDVCKKIGLPRWRGLEHIREIQWAIIQHYSLWPTPMIDLTTSLRVASTFALGFGNEGKIDSKSPVNVETGYLFVVAMPHPNASITFDIDQHIALARLNSCCPPIATRPHLQDGFLVGRFPFKNTVDRDSSNKSGLSIRTVAIIELVDKGDFWTKSHPKLPKDALLPTKDPLRDAFEKRFGDGGNYSLIDLARSIENHVST